MFIWWEVGIGNKPVFNLISSSLAKMMTARALDVSRSRRMILSYSPALGSRGIFTDCATHKLPANTWKISCFNVVFKITNRPLTHSLHKCNWTQTLKDNSNFHFIIHFELLIKLLFSIMAGWKLTYLWKVATFNFYKKPKQLYNVTIEQLNNFIQWSAAIVDILNLSAWLYFKLTNCLFYYQPQVSFKSLMFFPYHPPWTSG